MSGSYAITGIPLPSQRDPAHPIPLRKEVTAWASDPENAVQLSLFIQAMTIFQSIPHTDKLSYYQIAGIHGLPATTWDGAQTPNAGSWYCNHQLTTFPTWHRPYMLLFEQRLYEIMMSQIVNKVQPASEQSIWAIEASHWRLPYWDWAAAQPYLNDVGVPLIFTQQQLSIVMPNNQTQKVDNPLWAFKNPENVAMGDASMGQWAITQDPYSSAVATSRHGNDQDPAWANGMNNYQVSNQALEAHAWDPSWVGTANPAISDLVSRLLSDGYLKTWRFFSSTLHAGEGRGTVPSITDFLSLEQIHNTIHFTGGGNGDSDIGHMQDPSVASFDPIFFLHHCNVDRQLAMWQTLNPDQWFDNLDPGDNGPDVALFPFHKDSKSTPFTSNDIRDWTKLNYQYDNLENTPRWIRVQTQGRVTQDHIQGHVRRSVNLHLNQSRQAVLASPKLQGRDRDYIINVLYDRYGLGGRSYSIHFFIGHAPEGEGAVYQQSPGYIGTVYTFSSSIEVSEEGKCQNCIQQSKARMMSKAQLVLTSKLIAHAIDPSIQEINSLRSEEVESYLTKHLSWKIVAARTGRTVGIEQELPRTKVYVLAGKAEHFEDPHHASRYGEYEHMFGPTEGKAGGAVPGDRGRHM